MTRRKRRRGRRLLAALLLLAALAAGLVLLLRSRLEPIVENLAVNQVEGVISGAINDAIYAQITSGEISYDRMIYFEKDLNGAITALKTNMGEVNRLKSQLLTQLDQRVAVLDSQQMQVALGSVLLPTLLTGRGPGIPVEIVSVTNSDARFSNSFSEAGINQTLHQIYLTVSVDVTILMPTKTVCSTVSSQMVVAQTVLVGGVPGTYAILQNT